MLALAATLSVEQATAQFTDIFRDPPPRPPAAVPNRPPLEPLPPPLNVPPARRPGAGQIQSQPLPPPPGAEAQPQDNQQPGVRVLPGLAPGQRQPRGTPQQQQQQPAAIEPPADEVVVAPPEQKIANPTAVFSGLDKITGRIIEFDVAIDETVQFGALQVTPRVCYSRPPTETQNTDAFVSVDEVTLQGDVKRIFTGWMFASSPGLHAVEHAIYDVWLTDCKGGGEGPVTDETPLVAADVPLPRPKPR